MGGGREGRYKPSLSLKYFLWMVVSVLSENWSLIS